METNNILTTLIWVNYFWLNLGLIGFFLIQLRKDREMINENMKNIFRGKFHHIIFSIIIIYIMLPISIIFSVNNLWRK